MKENNDNYLLIIPQPNGTFGFGALPKQMTFLFQRKNKVQEILNTLTNQYPKYQGKVARLEFPALDLSKIEFDENEDGVFVCPVN